MTLRAAPVLSASLAETHEQWATIMDEVDRFVDRLPLESQRLWERLRTEI